MAKAGSSKPCSATDPGNCLFVCSVACCLLDHHDLFLAGLLLLGFFAMLRTGELLDVRPEDILIRDATGMVFAKL